MFREFAVTLSVAVAISMIVSLTTTHDVRQASEAGRKTAQAQLVLPRQ